MGWKVGKDLSKTKEAIMHKVRKNLERAANERREPHKRPNWRETE